MLNPNDGNHVSLQSEIDELFCHTLVAEFINQLACLGNLDRPDERLLFGEMTGLMVSLGRGRINGRTVILDVRIESEAQSRYRTDNGADSTRHGVGRTQDDVLYQVAE